MRKLVFTVFLWFWLTLIALVVMIVVVTHGVGPRRGWMAAIHLHDFMVYTIGGALFCYFISHYLTTPLVKLGEAAAEIAEGRLETRVDVSLKRRRDEVAELASNFDRMAERIEALVSGQRRLLGDVSHELRSPLARLMVAQSLVKQGTAEEADEALERIGVEARRLDALIGELLTLTRIDSGVDRGARARFDLTNLVQEVASDGDFEARARNRSVVVQAGDACMVEGFEELIRSAVENVVRNAVRYTAEGTAVEISVERHDSNARIWVRDHGPGVPENMLREIFQPFRRVEGDGEGAGLGLAIAERAITVHGGSIRATNPPGGGLAVEIELPAE